MATLNTPYWNVVTPEMRRLLIRIGQQPFSNDFYLAGGTALSLQMGHRRSDDLDFFSERNEVNERSRDQILKQLSGFSVQVVENVTGNLLLVVEDVKTGFFSYGYPLVDRAKHVENLALASLADIGLMKCDALISRGSRKDFYDLFFIARHLQFEQLFLLSKKKYRLFRDFPLMVLESMTLFDNAERDVQPDLFDDISWEQVKQFFIQQANLLSNSWFKG